MSLPMSRRKFALAASSVGSVLIADPLNVLAKRVQALLGARRNMGGGSSSVIPYGAASQPQAGGHAKPKVLVFDVNQTLLDLNALRPPFARVFGDGRALDEWFALLLQYSLIVTVTDAYSDFGTVGKAVLEMLASNKGVKLTPQDATRILQGMLALPAHLDVGESLKRLRGAGFRMVTLTNSSPTAVKTQLQNAGLAQYFEEAISVETVHRFKPDLEVYRSAAAHIDDSRKM